MTLAYVGHFLISSGVLGVGPQTLWIWWAGMVGLGLAGQFLLQASIPPKPGASSAGNQVQSTLWMCAGFVLFRFFDILKPFPLKRLERAPGGWGVMLDDLGAGIYSAGGLLVLSFVWPRWFALVSP